MSTDLSDITGEGLTDVSTVTSGDFMACMGLNLEQVLDAEVEGTTDVKG